MIEDLLSYLGLTSSMHLDTNMIIMLPSVIVNYACHLEMNLPLN